MREELLGLPPIAFWLSLLFRRLIPVLVPSGFSGVALGVRLPLQFILLLVEGRVVAGVVLFHDVLRYFSCHRPEWADDVGVGLGVEQCRCVARLQV